MNGLFACTSLEDVEECCGNGSSTFKTSINFDLSYSFDEQYDGICEWDHCNSLNGEYDRHTPLMGLLLDLTCINYPVPHKHYLSDVGRPVPCCS